MELVRAEPCKLGPFLAGVSLQTVLYNMHGKSDLDPFKGLLLDFFLVAVGATNHFNLTFFDK